MFQPTTEPGRWAKTILMAGLKEVPYVGKAVKVCESVQYQNRMLTIESDIDDLKAGLTRTEMRIRDVVQDVIAEVVDELRSPGIDGQTLQRLVREVRELQDNRYNPMFFDGLLANSSHYEQIKQYPETYGKLLPPDAEVTPGHFPLFIDLEESGETRILEVPALALQVLLAAPEREGAQARFLANAKAVSDVWAAPNPSSRVVVCGGGAARAAEVFRDRLSDGSQGPEMVWIPPGRFEMGGQQKDTEQPIHRVEINYPLAVGKYPVTFEEYDRFCDATGAEKPNDKEWGREYRPVINVSWHDANEYCAWLSRETGHEYRLLSEAEWEYAARAGTTTEYPWGHKIGVNNCNCAGSGSCWSNESTSPVGAFTPNAFGLYDMHGNVREWCEDVWHYTYKGAPNDGSAWMSNEEGVCRMQRGGSWVTPSNWTRSATRSCVHPARRHSFFGFRLSRTQ